MKIGLELLDTDLILGGWRCRNVGRRALEMGVKGGPLIWGLDSTPPRESKKLGGITIFLRGSMTHEHAILPEATGRCKRLD